LSEILADTLKGAGVWNENQKEKFPVIVKRGVNDFGKNITYYLNYSGDGQQAVHGGKDGMELFSEKAVNSGETMELEPWGVKIVEEN
ncbi:MAG: beta-galactosidase, partial [Lachnospiraceae bacterium]|nr:beta-galactosidase [Lachnospiraceae bacterium]